MKKTFFLGVMIGIAMTAFAHEPLDSVFNQFSAHKNALATEVKYSGTFSPDGPGFIFQRPDGEGWTKGTRLTIPQINPEEADNVIRVFDESEEDVGFVLKITQQRVCFDEDNMVGYALSYDKDTHTLYFLRAQVEDKICIPADWTRRDYYYAPANTNRPGEPRSVNWPAAMARLYSEIKYNSPFHKKIAAQLDSVYYDALEDLKTADDYESFRLLQKLAATCRDGHTYVFSGQGRIEQPVWSPFTTVLLGDRLFIRSVESTQLEEAGMKRGMEILTVNGESPREYATRELLPYVSASTPQWADHEMFDGYGFSTGRKGSPLNLALTGDAGKHSVTITHNIGDTKPLRRKAIRPERSFRIVDGNIALLTLPDFASPEVTEFFDSVYPRILESEALIIDIRGNGGGNTNYATHILARLTNDSIQSDPWLSPVYIPAYASWGRDRKFHHEPSHKMPPAQDITPYLGPVAVLTDRGTFSAAEDFCAMFRGMKRGPIVGTPTGGSTGNGVQTHLTKGIYANICSKHDFMPDGTAFVGIGIIPDIIIEETPESYFSDTTDIVLSKAISTLLPD